MAEYNSDQTKNDSLTKILHFLLKIPDDEQIDFYAVHPMLLYILTTRLIISEFTNLTDLEELFRKDGAADQEYAYYSSFDPKLIADMMTKGLFPMAEQLSDLWLPVMRHHIYKCVIPLNPNTTFTYHKSIRRYARRMPDLILCFDRDFDEVINNIEQAYKDKGTWLAPSLVEAYKAIFNHNDDDTYQVKIHSVEVYNQDKLVAGEIGFISGDIYTSLSGFHLVPNTGSIQMAALGTYLMQNGFKTWDLGMELDYKWEYGSLRADRNAQKVIYKDCPKQCRPLTKNEMLIKDLLDIK